MFLINRLPAKKSSGECLHLLTSRALSVSCPSDGFFAVGRVKTRYLRITGFNPCMVRVLMAGIFAGTFSNLLSAAG